MVTASFLKILLHSCFVPISLTATKLPPGNIGYWIISQILPITNFWTSLHEYSKKSLEERLILSRVAHLSTTTTTATTATIPSPPPGCGHCSCFVLASLSPCHVVSHQAFSNIYYKSTPESAVHGVGKPCHWSKSAKPTTLNLHSHSYPHVTTFAFTHSIFF